MTNPKVSIVYHSGYGHTQRIAQAVADGASAELLAIDADGNLPAGGWELLSAADAIVLGSPTYMGGVSWQFKKFADAVQSQPKEAKGLDSALRSLARTPLGPWLLVVVAAGLVTYGAYSLCAARWTET